MELRILSRAPLIPVYGGGPCDGSEITRGPDRLTYVEEGVQWDYRLCRDNDGVEQRRPIRTERTNAARSEELTALVLCDDRAFSPSPST